MSTAGATILPVPVFKANTFATSALAEVAFYMAAARQKIVQKDKKAVANFYSL